MAKKLLKYQCDEGFPSNTRVQQMPVFQQWTKIHDLIGNDCWILFKLLLSNAGASFLTTNPKLQIPNLNLESQKVEALIKAIPVNNDTFEQALGLLLEFHDTLTRNSTAKQNIFIRL